MKIGIKQPSVCLHLKKKHLIKLKQINEIKKECRLEHLHQEPTKIGLFTCLECLEVCCDKESTNKCIYKHYIENGHNIIYNNKKNLLKCLDCNEDLHESLKSKKILCIEKNYQNLENLLKQFDQIVFSNKRKLKTIGKEETEHFNLANNKQQNSLSMLNKEKKDNVFGLMNLGNTCYFNSVLQMFLNTDIFLEFFQSHIDKITADSLPMEILKLSTGNDRSKNTNKIYKKLIMTNGRFSFNKQQDANECLLLLFELLDRDYVKLGILKDHPFIGYYIYQMSCRKCNTSKYYFEQSSFLFLDLMPDNSYEKLKNNLYDEMDKLIKDVQYVTVNNNQIQDHEFLQRSKFDKNKDKLCIKLISKPSVNQKKMTDLQKLIFYYFDFTFLSHSRYEYTCEDLCKDNSTFGFKKNYILKPPPLLIICLKRFDKDSFFTLKKSDKSIPIDEIVDLSNYMIHYEKKKNVKVRYQLYTTINHQGNLNSGHYTCFTRKETGQWYYISDALFARVDLEKVLKSEPYMLFYKRIIN